MHRSLPTRLPLVPLLIYVFPQRHPPWEDFELSEHLSMSALLTSLAPTVYSAKCTDLFLDGPTNPYSFNNLACLE